MPNMSYQDKDQAEKELQDAFKQLKLKRSYSQTTSQAKVEYSGISSAKSKYSNLISDLDNLLQYAKNQEFRCNRYVIQSCPAFSAAIQNSPVTQWSEQALLEAKKAFERVQIAVKGIDDYAAKKSKEIAVSWMEQLKKLPTDIERFRQQPMAESQRYINKISHSGLGRPWGTEIRQRIAIAAGLKTDVNNIWQVGLNSVANSASINLGSHFIELIEKDPAMEKVIAEVNKQILKDIKFRAVKAPYLIPQKIDQNFSGRKPVELGGKRHRDDMLKQLKFTVLNPKQSLKKYADTWNVGFNELTWTIRHCMINFKGVYHCVYNIHGFAFVWEGEFWLQDSFDLRPRFGGKLNFNTPYNIVTSILGTVYHDLIGNTDKMKICAKWNGFGDGNNKIHSW